jgi:hypothetical protein
MLMAQQLERPKIPEPADETEILREQLEYLMDHTARNAQCGCSECRRYQKVRAALLEIFTEPPRAIHLVKAA